MTHPLETYLSDNGVKLDARFIAYHSADSAKDGWGHFEWSVTLICGEQSFTTAYRTGLGHRDCDSVRAKRWILDPRAPKRPSLADVVSSLLSDAQCSADSFEDFCADCGYDTDSRKALETYLACQTIGTAVRRLFGAKYSAVCDAAQDY